MNECLPLACRRAVIGWLHV